jgi:ribose-phosphate pyrophosphokinase
MQNEVLLFAGNSNRPLAEKISEYLDTNLGKATVGKFSDGETRVTIEESVRGKRIFLLQSTSTPANDNLMELLIMVDALKRASALSVTAVVPYYGYARQDRKARARDPITAKLVANLLTVSGIDRLVSIDMHVAQLQGFFDIPVDHLQAFPVFVDYLKKTYKDEISNFTVVSPDVG